MMIAVLTLEEIYIAFVAVLAVAEAKEKATFPNVCDVVVLLVMESRGRRVAPAFALSSDDNDSLPKIDVPPITIGVAFPSTLISSLSNSTNPRFVEMTGSTETAED
jgi:hypothetical protein